MKKVWLAQPTEMKKNSIYLPYSIGVLAAYSWQFPEIKSQYDLQEFLIFMDDVQTVVNRMDNPYMVAFSSYLWNINYNLSLAAAVKEAFPQCLIVFGGPDVPENKTFLEQYDFIDILIFGEGEEPFYQLLTALKNGDDFSKVTSIAYRTGGEIRLNEIVTPKDISNYPSPYLEGYFDHIINNPKNEGLQFDIVLETNRGCPYKCLYCSWGMKDAPVRKFNMDRVKGDIKWMVDHKIAYCFLADGNFGILKRDQEIADYLFELKKTSEYPQALEIFTAKNKDEFVFEINKKLNAAGLNRGVDIACQTLTPQVLKNMGRQNLSLEKFTNEVRKYREAGIFSYTDMILGLPGESYESFCESLFNVYEAGQHYLMVYLCELLPCSRMAQPEVMAQYKIQTMKSNLCQIHTSIFEDKSNKSRSEVVIATYSMTKEDWLQMNIVALIAQAFHGFGLTRFIANYIRRACGVTYHDFYLALIDYLQNKNAFTKGIIEYTTASLHTFLRGESNIFFFDRRFGDVYFDLNEGVFACFAAEKDEFYRQITPFLRQYIRDEALFEDLMRYQISKITFPFVGEHTEHFCYDWEDYFSDIYNNTPKKPTAQDNEITFYSQYYDDLVKYYHDIIWVGKRREKTFVKSKRQPIQ